MQAIAIAPDGDWLATGGRDASVRVWETASWTQKAAFRGHPHGVRAIAIAPDGGWLATGGRDASVRICGTPGAGSARRVLNTRYDPGQSVAIAPDGAWLAARGIGGRVRIWETATWTQTATLAGHDRDLKALAIAPDGSLLATADVSGSLRVWDITSGRALAMMRVDDTLGTCAWVTSSRLILGGTAGLYSFHFQAG